MALGVEEAVLLGLRIEVRASRLEVRSIALGILMEVQCMLARRQLPLASFNSTACFLTGLADWANAARLRAPNVAVRKSEWVIERFISAELYHKRESDGEESEAGVRSRRETESSRFWTDSRSFSRNWTVC
jgi:hypothetical protein